MVSSLVFALAWIGKAFGLWVLYTLVWFLLSAAVFYIRRVEGSALTLGQASVFGVMNTVVHVLIYILCKIICY